jgi:UDP-GlcNAc:undecaprenyl-phosphate GlcNAc-1-phosphate transferase
MELLEQYQNFFLLVGVVTVLSFLLAPIAGAIAMRIGAVDKPAQLRDRNDPTRFRKIHDVIMPQLGGAAVFVSFAIGAILAYQSGALVGVSSQQLLMLSIAIFVIVALGFWDSITDVPARTQIMLQFLAAIIVTMAGIKILNIEILSTFINFDWANFTIPVAGLQLQFNLPADIITWVWIVGVVNAINWVDGIDGLSSSMVLFAALTLVFIGVKYEAMFAAVLAAILFGSVLGYLPFNLPPAKTYAGGIGVMFPGFLLSILAIMSGAKLSTALILLALPVIDAMWVLWGRFRNHRREIKSIFDLMRISDKTHLHHRLLDIGLSKKQALVAEISIFLVFCVAAYYLAGFSEGTVGILIALAFVLIVFTVVSILSRRAARRKPVLEKEKAAPKVKVATETPEEKYAY